MKCLSFCFVDDGRKTMDEEQATLTFVYRL